MQNELEIKKYLKDLDDSIRKLNLTVHELWRLNCNVELTVHTQQFVGQNKKPYISHAVYVDLVKQKEEKQ